MLAVRKMTSSLALVVALGSSTCSSAPAETEPLRPPDGSTSTAPGEVSGERDARLVGILTPEQLKVWEDLESHGDGRRALGSFVALSMRAA